MAKTPSVIQAKKISPLVRKLAELVKTQGGFALLVGGSTRDLLLNKTVSDFDIEVHGLPAVKVRALAGKLGGKVFEAGRAFGVLKITKGKHELDISLPRSDSKTAPGHRGFAVNADPFMGIKEAARRRDFTINAIALDLHTGEINDPFGGLKDLKNKILRVVDPKTFSDDPLRALRAAQMVSRFDLKIHKNSLPVLKKTSVKINELSRERIWAEWKKLLLADRPSLGLQAMKDLGIIKKFYPELQILGKTPQDKKWHPEGNVWNHTKMVVDAAAKITRREKLDKPMTLTLMLAALCHDIGKGTTTKFFNGRWRSFDHEEQGAVIARKFLDRVGADKITINKVSNLVLNHMRPLYLWQSSLATKVSDSAIFRLADSLAKDGLNIKILNHLGEADFRGTKGFELKTHQVGGWLGKRAATLKVQYNKPADIVRGRDLIKLGLKPGPQFGKLINEANRLHKEKGYNKHKILKLLKRYV